MLRVPADLATATRYVEPPPPPENSPSPPSTPSEHSHLSTTRPISQLIQELSTSSLPSTPSPTPSLQQQSQYQQDQPWHKAQPLRVARLSIKKKTAAAHVYTYDELDNMDLTEIVDRFPCPPTHGHRPWTHLADAACHNLTELEPVLCELDNWLESHSQHEQHEQQLHPQHTIVTDDLSRSSSNSSNSSNSSSTTSTTSQGATTTRPARRVRSRLNVKRKFDLPELQVLTPLFDNLVQTSAVAASAVATIAASHPAILLPALPLSGASTSPATFKPPSWIPPLPAIPTKEEQDPKDTTFEAAAEKTTITISVATASLDNTNLGDTLAQEIALFELEQQQGQEQSHPSQFEPLDDPHPSQGTTRRLETKARAETTTTMPASMLMSPLWFLSPPRPLYVISRKIDPPSLSASNTLLSSKQQQQKQQLDGTIAPRLTTVTPATPTAPAVPTTLLTTTTDTPPTTAMVSQPPALTVSPTVTPQSPKDASAVAYDFMDVFTTRLWDMTFAAHELVVARTSESASRLSVMFAHSPLTCRPSMDLWNWIEADVDIDRDVKKGKGPTTQSSSTLLSLSSATSLSEASSLSPLAATMTLTRESSQSSTFSSRSSSSSSGSSGTRRERMMHGIPSKLGSKSKGAHSLWQRITDPHHHHDHHLENYRGLEAASLSMPSLSSSLTSASSSVSTMSSRSRSPTSGWSLRRLMGRQPWSKPSPLLSLSMA